MGFLFPSINSVGNFPLCPGPGGVGVRSGFGLLTNIRYRHDCAPKENTIQMGATSSWEAPSVRATRNKWGALRQIIPLLLFLALCPVFLFVSGAIEALVNSGRSDFVNSCVTKEDNPASPSALKFLITAELVV